MTKGISVNEQHEGRQTLATSFRAHLQEEKMKYEIEAYRTKVHERCCHAPELERSKRVSEAVLVGS